MTGLWCVGWLCLDWWALLACFVGLDLVVLVSTGFGYFGVLLRIVGCGALDWLEWLTLVLHLRGLGCGLWVLIVDCCLLPCLVDL